MEPACSGALFARIVPKSNMHEAVRGETFEITLTKGYFTEAKEEARAIAHDLPEGTRVFQAGKEGDAPYQEQEGCPTIRGSAEGRILPCGY